LVKRFSKAEVSSLMFGTSCSIKEEYLSRASEEMQSKQQAVCLIFEELERARAKSHTKISSILRQLPEKAYARGVEEAKKEVRTLKEKIETKMESSEAMKISNVRIQVSSKFLKTLLDEQGLCIPENRGASCKR
jgi:hypothetical protein